MQSTKEVIETLLHDHKNRGNLLPVLQQVQQRLGYIPEETMREIANQLAIPEVDVFAVVTFYHQFRRQPPGKQQVKVCAGTACHMKGSAVILDCWERRLGIKAGEVTADGTFGLERVACVGCCAMAPVVVVSGTTHAKVTPTKVDGILHSCRPDLEREKNNDGLNS